MMSTNMHIFVEDADVLASATTQEDHDTVVVTIGSRKRSFGNFYANPALGDEYVTLFLAGKPESKEMIGALDAIIDALDTLRADLVAKTLEEVPS